MKVPRLRSLRTSKPLVGVLCIVLVAIGFGITYLVLPKSTPAKVVHTAAVTKPVAKQAETPLKTVPGLQLDNAKKYGNKYASGVLPVGDKKYSTTAASQGSIYACSQYASNLSQDGGSAGQQGPWFSADGRTYDIKKKTHVSGAVKWGPQFSNTVSGTQRTIVTNDLPSHTTGVFPIASSDPAYLYDRNPNRIQTQSLTYSLPTAPTYGAPQCISGDVGIMLSGIALFSAFDASGRDAGAWEVQDDCSGHPQMQGEYHYHTLSSCIGDTTVNQVIGYALDGFPITGPKVSEGNILTTSDLDECHGIFSDVTLNGKTSLTYHYVMTQEFPYSISCYRSTPTQVTDALHTDPLQPMP